MYAESVHFQANIIYVSNESNVLELLALTYACMAWLNFGQMPIADAYFFQTILIMLVF